MGEILLFIILFTEKHRKFVLGLCVCVCVYVSERERERERYEFVSSLLWGKFFFYKGTWQILRGIRKCLDILERWQIKIVLPKKLKTDCVLRKLANHSCQNFKVCSQKSWIMRTCKILILFFVLNRNEIFCISWREEYRMKVF